MNPICPICNNTYIKIERINKNRSYFCCYENTQDFYKSYLKVRDNNIFSFLIYYKKHWIYWQKFRGFEIYIAGLDSNLMEGPDQLSPIQGLNLLKRYCNLLVFS